MKSGRDILSGFGRDSNAPAVPRATNGGQMPVKPIPYSAPKGPSNINDPKSPGIHGTNYGCYGSQKEG